jgi:hypothetical protein
VANVIEIVIHATDAATAQIKGVQGAVGTLGSSLRGIVGLLGGPVGIAAGFATAGIAAVSLGNKLSDQIEELSNLSARTGASINELRALRQVMTEAGQSSESLTSALTIANRNLATNRDNLAEVGITADTAMEALLQLSDMVTKTGNTSKTTAAAFALLGRGGGELIPILNNLRPAMSDMRERLGDLSAETIEAAKRWDEMIDRMKTSTKSFLDGTGGAFLRWWDRLMRTNSTEDPRTWANMFRVGQTLPREAFPGYDIRPPGAPEPGPPDPFAVFRMFPETVAGDVQRRGGITATTEAQFAKLNDTWNATLDLTAKLREGAGAFRLDLEVLGYGVESMAFAFSDAFDAIVFRGQNAADAIRGAFMSAIRDITNELVKIGIGLGLQALGGNIGGVTGGVIEKVGRRFAGVAALSGGGNTININTLDTRTLRTQLMPGGSLARAQDQVRIGGRY